MPGGAAALAPGFHLAGFGVRIVRPGRRPRVAAGGAFLAVEPAHVPFHEGPHPDFLAGVRVAGEQTAHHAEFIPGGAVDQQHLAGLLILHDGGRPGHGVAHLVVGELLAPRHPACVLVERHDAGVQGAEEDLVAVDGGTPVDHVAAGPDVVRQPVAVVPEFLAGARVDGEHPGIGTGHVDHAVVNQGLGLLATLLLIAERERPGRRQHAHVVRVDVGQGAVALGLHAQAVHQHVVGGFRVVEYVLPGNVLGQGAATGTQTQQGRHRKDADYFFHGLSLLMVETAI
ncbi:hypothetical protein ASALC70_03949 [Alcanivorax sp. ALC70]|nr:hypothetical protein ASALC70_03949 [Alcanivorax sp. ALC70]